MEGIEWMERKNKDLKEGYIIATLKAHSLNMILRLELLYTALTEITIAGYCKAMNLCMVYVSDEM